MITEVICFLFLFFIGLWYVGLARKVDRLSDRIVENNLDLLKLQAHVKANEDILKLIRSNKLD